MGLKIAFFVIVMSICLGAGTVPDREPDIKSVRAKIEDYYTYDKETGKWLWIDDYKKLQAKRSKLASLPKPKMEKTPSSASEPTIADRIVEKKATTLVVEPKEQEKKAIEPDKNKEKELGFFAKIWHKIQHVFSMVLRFFKSCYHKIIYWVSKMVGFFYSI